MSPNNALATRLSLEYEPATAPRISLDMQHGPRKEHAEDTPGRRSATQTVWHGAVLQRGRSRYIIGWSLCLSSPLSAHYPISHNLSVPRPQHDRRARHCASLPNASHPYPSRDRRPPVWIELDVGAYGIFVVHQRGAHSARQYRLPVRA